jgi:transcriptional regulator of heat shock response
MTQLTKRNINILKIIVEEYLETGEVLGSKLLLQKYDL